MLEKSRSLALDRHIREFGSSHLRELGKVAESLILRVVVRTETKPRPGRI